MVKNLARLVGAGFLVGSSFLPAYADEKEKKADEKIFQGTIIEWGGRQKSGKLGRLFEIGGGLLRGQGEREHERIVARESADKTNLIIVNGKYYPAPGYDWADKNDPDNYEVVREITNEKNIPRDDLNPTSIIKHFACSRWDDNGNNIPSLDEFKERKLVFRRGEPIIIAASIESESARGKKITAKIYSSRGQIADQDWTIIGNPFCATLGHENSYDFSAWLFDRGGAGEYQVRWWYKGDIIGLTDFTITE